MLCIKCSAPVPAEPEEVAWVCSLCGQGMHLDKYDGLTSLDVHYAAGAASSGRGKPFWVVNGQVDLQRSTFKGNQEREADRFWMEPRLFFVPAFECPLDHLILLGSQMLKQPPELQAGSAIPFDPVVLPVASIRPTAEFILMALEAERKDKLRKLEFNLQLFVPELWVLPSR
jgi:hypothetical protein